MWGQSCIEHVRVRSLLLSRSTKVKMSKSKIKVKKTAAKKAKKANKTRKFYVRRCNKCECYVNGWKHWCCPKTDKCITIKNIKTQISKEKINGNGINYLEQFLIM